MKYNTQAPLSMAYRLYDSCSSEKQLYVVHGANHAENYDGPVFSSSDVDVRREDRKQLEEDTVV